MLWFFWFTLKNRFKIKIFTDYNRSFHVSFQNLEILLKFFVKSSCFFSIYSLLSTSISSLYLVFVTLFLQTLYNFAQLANFHIISSLAVAIFNQFCALWEYLHIFCDIFIVFKNIIQQITMLLNCNNSETFQRRHRI